MKRKAKELGKRAISLILALTLSFSMLPAAYADTGTTAEPQTLVMSGEPEITLLPGAEDYEILATNEEAEAPQDEENVLLSATDDEAEVKDEGFKFLGGTISYPAGDIYLNKPLTLKVLLARDDVEVSYQWQSLKESQLNNAILGMDIPEDVETEYSYQDFSAVAYVFTGESEPEHLKTYPDAVWPGIEMWRAVNEAAQAVGYTDNLTFELSTKNYVVMGYEPVVTYENNILNVSFVKGEEIITTTIDGNVISADEGTAYIDFEWEDVPGATSEEYTFTPVEEDEDKQFRCYITILDEQYLADAVVALKEQYDEEHTVDELRSYATGKLALGELNEYVEQEPSEDENSTIEPAEKLSFWQRIVQWFKNIWKWFIGLFIKPAEAASAPYLSADHNYIANVDYNTQYITKDYYEYLMSQGYNPAAADSVGKASGWTWVGAKGKAGNISGDKYWGYTLIDRNKLPVRSDWLGKTVYFRQLGNASFTAIDIPAVTEGQQHYNEWINVLNIYTADSTIAKNYTAFLAAVDAFGATFSDGAGGTMRIQPTTLEIEVFNGFPEGYLYDAEGTAIYDSVVFDGNVGDEPDISGAAFYALRDYIAQGYGLIIGHDTMYAYAGSYYDMYGSRFKPNTIQASDTSTYYDSDNFHVRENRTGHWKMNELVGWNNGNYIGGKTDGGDTFYIQSRTQALALSPSGVLSYGSEFGNRLADRVGKDYSFSKALSGDDDFEIKKRDYTYAQAVSNIAYRQPTNFPLSSADGMAFSVGNKFNSSHTHTNHQVFFGDIWVAYGNDTSVKDEEYQYTNNAYLSGNGNFLMNQYGHTVESKADSGRAEISLLINSTYYVSQRKQCEICQSSQNGHQATHFVHRINKTNATTILNALKDGGSYWYPINDCYVLVDDLTLPEGWSGIDNFNGHFNADGHEVKLASNGKPLFNQTVAKDKGWNLGTNSQKGVIYTHKNNIRTTSSARVVGFLSDLFGDDNTGFAGYKVAVLGSDNPSCISPTESYYSFVNNEGKYVLSNLPTIYNAAAQTGTLKVRVYDAKGVEVTKYGKICVDIPTSFWNTNMTTELYLGSVTAYPLVNQTTYEGVKVAYTATAVSDSDTSVKKWQYRLNDDDTWKDIPASMDVTYTDSVTTTTESGDTQVTQTMILNQPEYDMTYYEFRAVFTATNRGEWNTYQYYTSGSNNRETYASGYRRITVAKQDSQKGRLSVSLWPARLSQSAQETVYEGNGTEFQSTMHTLLDPNTLRVEWQYSPYAVTSNGETVFNNWKNIEADDNFGGLQEITNECQLSTGYVAVANIINSAEYQYDGAVDDFYARNPFYAVTTKLKLSKLDGEHNNYAFRAKYSFKTPSGVTLVWYSDIANGRTFKWSSDAPYWMQAQYNGNADSSMTNTLKVLYPEIYVITQKALDYNDSKNYVDNVTPDEYGQAFALDNNGKTTGTATYRAQIYYKPTRKPTIFWTYRTLRDSTTKNWNDTTAKDLYPNVTVTINNSAATTVSGGTYDGFNMIESTMTIKGFDAQMYDGEEMLKYFFRCNATSNYETVRGAKSRKHVANTWGGLTLDYPISIKHNGVFGTLGGKNTLAEEGWKNVKNVNSFQEAADYTNNLAKSEWKYPNLKITAPKDKIKTAMVYFGGKSGTDFNKSDKIHVDTAKLAEISSSKVTYSTDLSTDHKAVLVASGSVSNDIWEKILREAVKITTWDTIDYRSVKNGVPDDGVEVRWFISDYVFTNNSGMVIDPSTGNAYKVVSNNNTTWDVAKTNAEKDASAGVNGYLAEINSAAENSLVQNLLKDANADVAYIGGYNYGTNNQKWVHSGTSIGTNSYKNYATNSGKDNSNNIWMVMNSSDGKWSFVPEKTTESGKAGLTASGTWTKGTNGTYESSYTTATNSQGGSGGNTKTITIPAEYRSGLQSITFTAKVKADSSTGANIDNMFRINVYNTSGSKITFNSQRTGGSLHSNVTEVYSKADSSVEDTFTISNLAGKNVAKIEIYYYNNASSYAASVKGKYKNVTLNYSIVGRQPINYYVIEYNLPGFGAVFSTRTAEDSDRIGNIVGIPVDLTVNSAGNEKVYDGQPIKLKKFAVAGTDASADKFQITYSAAKSNGPKNGYETKTVNCTNRGDTGIINVGEYHYKISLTQEAKNAGYVLDETNSVLEGTLKITPKPVDLVSTGNNKTYNGTPDAIVNGLNIVNPGVPIDSLKPSKTNNIKAQYLADDGVIPDKNAGAKSLALLEEITLINNPHGNFELGNITVSGNINPRVISIHSNYKETKQTVYNPQTKTNETISLDAKTRNIKEYDGSREIFITDFVIDNIVKGDTVAVKPGDYKAMFETPLAEESLIVDSNGDGKEKENRYENLVVKPLALVEQLTNSDLINNEAGNYTVGAQQFSGSIYRAYLYATVKSTKSVYGSVNQETPYVSDTAYDIDHDGSESHLTIKGFKNLDKVHLINDKKADSGYQSKFVFSTIPASAVAGTSTEITYIGLNEYNYDVLKNYVVFQMPGSNLVTPRELKITVEGGYSKIYLAPNPTFTVKYEGFVNGDTPETALEGTLLIESPATQSSPILYRTNENGDLMDDKKTPADEHVSGSYGTYEVIASGLTCKKNINDSYNYILTYTNGDLMITEGDYEVEYKGNGATEGKMLNTTHTYNHTDKISPNSFARQYMITYDYNYGPYWVSPPNKSEKVNYKFAGWTTNGSLPSYNKQYGQSEYTQFKLGTTDSPAVNGDTMIADKSFLLNFQYTANDKLATLYALWIPKSVRLPKAVRPGYELDGWYEDTNNLTIPSGASPEEYVDVDSDGMYEHFVGDPDDNFLPTKNTTLLAKWNVVNSLRANVVNITPNSAFIDTNNFAPTDDGMTAIEIFGPVTKVTVDYPDRLVEIAEFSETQKCNLETKEYTVGDGHLIEVVPNEYYILQPTFIIPYEVSKDFGAFDGIIQTVVVTANYGPHGTLTANPIFYIVDNANLKFHTTLE